MQKGCLRHMHTSKAQSSPYIYAVSSEPLSRWVIPICLPVLLTDLVLYKNAVDREVCYMHYH